MGKQYIVFFGIGKTTWCKSHLNWADLDISYYMLPEQKAIIKLLYFYLRWDYNLLIGAGQYSAPIISQYAAAPNKIGYFRPMSINIILPCPEMKNEIVNRIKNRTADMTEVNDICRMYDFSWKAIDAMPFDTKVYLKPGQYLSDIIDENGEYKSGVEVIYGK